MNTSRQRRASGLTLIEIMASLSILGVAALGLVSSMVVAINGNALAARRTQMAQFAQARLERLITQTRIKIPTSTTTAPVNYSAMAASGTFDPTAAPNTGGWVLDVIDGAPPTAAGAGDDPMFGPVLFDDSAADGTDNFVGLTKTLRSTLANDWLAAPASNGTLGGCGAAAVVADAAVLCRELHVEPADSIASTPMLRAWVRVVQGGGNWQRSYVLMQEDIAQ